MMGDMSELDLIERLAAALASHIAQPIPLSAQLWDHGEVSRYFKRNTQVARETITCLPSFPCAIRLPGKGVKSHPLYNAGEVIEWAKKYREKH